MASLHFKIQNGHEKFLVKLRIIPKVLSTEELLFNTILYDYLYPGIRR